MKRVEGDLITLRSNFEYKSLTDNLAHARDRDELDFLANRRKEYKVLITGLESDVQLPTDRNERSEWTKEIVVRLLEVVLEGSSEKVVFVRSLWKGKDEVLPAAEVAFDVSDTALKVRRAFVQKRKEGVDFGRISMSNMVTLATRVRVDIMRAMERQFSTEDQKMYVRQFSSRPVITIKRKTNGTTKRV